MRQQPLLNWRVTRSLVSYDRIFTYCCCCCCIEGSPDHWWVTTDRTNLITCLFRLKGHQIIGELRLSKALSQHLNVIEGSPDHWWVTTVPSAGAIPPFLIEGSPDHWWVTTSPWDQIGYAPSIEGSPDHWWVTTQIIYLATQNQSLKGHQIIGELRLLSSILLLHQ